MISNKLLITLKKVLPYRYIRLVIIETRWTSEPKASLSELALKDGFGNTLTSPTTPIVASSSLSGFPPTNLLDGDTSSLWGSNTGDPLPVSITLDFTTQQKVKIITITAASGTASARRAPRSFTIQGSNDNVTFEDIKTFTDVPAWSSLEERTYEL